MQKVLTISIDLQQLTQQNDGVFSISEVKELNDILAEGWEIDDFTFLSDDAINGKMPLMVVLSDDLIENDLWPYEEDEDYLDEFEEDEFEAFDEDEEEEEDDDEEEEEEEKK